MFSFALTVVRHGETQYNKDRILQGQGIDSPLSDTGMSQAKAAGQHLRDVKFTNVFASPMERAKQTAKIIMESNVSCIGVNMDMVIDPSLTERNLGIAEGGPVECLINMAKEAGQSLPEFTPPEGETMEQVKARITQFLNNMFKRIMDGHGDKAQPEDTTMSFEDNVLLDRHPDDGAQGLPVHALVVTHGIYMRVLARYFVEDLQCPLPQGVAMAHMFSLCPNTGMCRFIITLRCCEADHPVSAIKCVFINRGDHLVPCEN